MPRPYGAGWNGPGADEKRDDAGAIESQGWCRGLGRVVSKSQIRSETTPLDTLSSSDGASFTFGNDPSQQLRMPNCRL